MPVKTLRLTPHFIYECFSGLSFVYDFAILDHGGVVILTPWRRKTAS